MAITEDRPLALEAGTVTKVAERPLGALTRPQSDVGWASWFTTVDHKKIGNHVRRWFAVLLLVRWRRGADDPHPACGPPTDNSCPNRSITRSSPCMA